jgi:cytidylate kinase
MCSLLIVTGPPGSGKSTASRLLADGMERSVLVEGDLFFAFLATGAIAPWLPESAEQNHVVGDAAAAVSAGAVQERHVIESGSFDLAALADEIRRRRSAGDLLLG